MTPKPALGYGSRTAAVLALRGQGMSDAAIAAKLGITAKVVADLAYSKQRTTSRRSREVMIGTAQVGIHITTLCRFALRPHAAKRQLSVDTLAQLLLEKIGDDDLVDAVLDDKGVLYV